MVLTVNSPYRRVLPSGLVEVLIVRRYNAKKSGDLVLHCSKVILFVRSVENRLKATDEHLELDRPSPGDDRATYNLGDGRHWKPRHDFE